MNLSGLILLVFIGIGVAWVWTKARKRFGLSSNGKTWLGAVIVAVVLIMIIYGASHTTH